MKNDNLYSSLFVAAVWVTVILLIGFKCYQSVTTLDNDFDFRVKTLDEMIDASH